MFGVKTTEPNREKQEEKSRGFRYPSLTVGQTNGKVTKTRNGMASIPNRLENDDFININAKDSQTLIFNDEHQPFLCSGSCVCSDSSEATGRRIVSSSRTTISKGLSYLLAAVSSMVAYKLSEKHFTTECNNRHHECSLIESEVEECVALRYDIRDLRKELREVKKKKITIISDEEYEEMEFQEKQSVRDEEIFCRGNCDFLNFFPKSILESPLGKLIKEHEITPDTIRQKCQSHKLQKILTFRYFGSAKINFFQDEAYSQFEDEMEQFCTQASDKETQELFGISLKDIPPVSRFSNFNLCRVYDENYVCDTSGWGPGLRKLEYRYDEHGNVIDVDE